MEIVIVGGGIAGLYAAYRLSLLGHAVLVLEKETTLGGRAGAQSFAGTSVLTGAGVGRKDKDKRLVSLLHKLRVPYRKFIATQQFSPAFPYRMDVKKTFLKLRRAFAKAREPQTTFRKFALSQLGTVDAYRQFVQLSGYSDYEQADAGDVFYRYGFDDNFNDWNAMGIVWKDLIDALANGFKIVKGATVTNISKGANPVVHWSSSRGNYSITCDHVILATTVDVVQRLLPECPMYGHIHSQPFLRIYGQFSKKCRHLMKEAVSTTTIVPGPLHKLIPTDTDRGVYMIAYTDNADALRVEKIMHSMPALCRMLESALALPPDSLELIKTRLVPWTIGTHYNDPHYNNLLKNVQMPFATVSVVGEMVSLSNQGWVEGALESVDARLSTWK